MTTQITLVEFSKCAKLLEGSADMSDSLDGVKARMKIFAPGLTAQMFADLAYLIAFADLALEELGRHWFNGGQKTVDECSHCGAIARDDLCWAAQLKQKLEAL